MNIYIALLLLTVIIVFVVDLSGFTEAWKAVLSKWLGVQVGRVKPFDCSMCLSWWVGLLYAAIAGEFTLPVIAYLAVLAYLAGLIADILRMMRDLIGAGVNALWRLVDKLNK